MSYFYRPLEVVRAIFGKSRRTARVSILSRKLAVECLEDRRLLATYTVDTAADEFNFLNADTSLREAIFLANSQNDEVHFNPSNVDGATISLSLGEIAIGAEKGTFYFY